MKSMYEREEKSAFSIITSFQKNSATALREEEKVN